MPDPSPAASSLSTASVELIPGGPVCGVIRPPGSKSLTNRALICAAMAKGRSVLTGALASEDTEVMIDALRAIGVELEVSQGGSTIDVAKPAVEAERSQPEANQPNPIQPNPAQALELFIANSGTSIRFLTAALSALGGHYRLHGVPRMHQRPIADLVDAIADVIDGTIQTESPDGCPPVQIDARGWSGRDIRVAGSVSSQFLSGLMMAAPIASLNPSHQGSTRIGVVGELVSRPYVDMTAEVMRAFGAQVEVSPAADSAELSLTVEVANVPYQGTRYAIEPDASAASYFWAAAAITGGSIKVQGLTRHALQGDVGFCDVLEKMGCEVIEEADGITVTGHPLQGVDVDMNQISDTVQTLAVVALFAKGPTRVRGVAHNRFKETDRIGDLACELRKLGGSVQEHDDGLTIEADPSRLHGAVLSTYHDHRMAMSLALAGLRLKGVRILDPACTSKTYPEYFADMEQLTGRAHHWTDR